MSPERKAAVIQEISEGSLPGPRFYVMVIISNLIAVLGLIANSPAVIIGAMLVAPFMTPIFGIALALVQGNSVLLGRAIRAEFQGVVLAVFLCLVVGSMPLAINPTEEILARTEPNLLDLMVAVFAGMAGAYAMVDERISPSLPGVAIATAIVPPLANTGLCLAIGEYMGGVGSFLLFLANFLSILLVSAVVFALTGMGVRFKKISSKDITRRFGVALVSFLMIAVFFTFSLVKLVQRRHVRNLVENTMVEELYKIPGTFLREFFIQKDEDLMHVLATIRTPKIVSPEEVGRIQTTLSERLNRNIDLVIRNNLVKDIAATGSTMAVAVLDPDGKFLEDTLSVSESKSTIAEQVFYEKFSKRPGFRVLDMAHHEATDGELLLASVETLYPIRLKDIQELEVEISRRIQEDDVSLVVSEHIPTLYNKHGKILFEWSRYEDLTEEKSEKMDSLKQRITEIFSRKENVFLISAHFRISSRSWNVLLEVTGTRMITRNEITALQEEISELAQRPITVSVWFKNEAVITEQGPVSYETFVEDTLRKNIVSFREAIEGDKTAKDINDPNQ
ncbi:MAG: TIGR00341 family protein [Planctomycetota bacterium]